MDFATILIDDEDSPQPRGTKRQRDGTPRPLPFGYAYSASVDGAFPSAPAHESPGRYAFPARGQRDPDHITSSSNYGTSSPFRHLYEPHDSIDFETALDQVDGLPFEHTRRASYPRGPGPDIFNSFSHEPSRSRRSSSSPLRSFAPSSASTARSMGQDQSTQNSSNPQNQNQNHNSSVPTTPSDSLFVEYQPRQLGEIDLTQEDDTMDSTRTHRSRKRPRQPPDMADDGAPGPSGIKRSRTAANAGPIESISLIDDDNDPAAASLLRKQRSDQMEMLNDTTPATAGPSGTSASSAAAPKRKPTKLTSMTCTICMDSPTELTATTCGHLFCRKCIQEWLSSSDFRVTVKKCPSCRTPLATEGLGSARAGPRSKGGCVALEFMKRKKPQAQQAQSVG